MLISSRDGGGRTKIGAQPRFFLSHSDPLSGAPMERIVLGLATAGALGHLVGGLSGGAIVILITAPCLHFWEKHVRRAREQSQPAMQVGLHA